MDSWLSVDVSSGTGNGEVNVTAAENTGEERDATIIISGNGLSQEITVTQEGDTSRSIYVDVFLVSFGWTTNNICENVYGIQANTGGRKLIRGGSVTISVEVKDPTNSLITTKTLIINDGKFESQIEYVSVQSNGLFDSSSRYTVYNIRNYVTYSIKANSTPLAMNEGMVTLNDSNILTIPSKVFNASTSIELRDDTNVAISLGRLATTKYLMVSWPYRGGLNLCAYNVSSKYVSSDTSSFGAEFTFELAKTSFDIGGGIMKEYYDIWNCIMSEGYKPVKKFKLTYESDNATLALKYCTISGIEYVEGLIYGYLILNDDGTIDSVNVPYQAGLADDSGYGGLSLGSTTTGPDSKRIVWYHKPIEASEDIVKTIIRRVDEPLNFTSSDFLETTTSNVIAYSDERYAEIEHTKTVSSGEKNMERFYHPNVHPNITIKG